MDVTEMNSLQSKKLQGGATMLEVLVSLLILVLGLLGMVGLQIRAQLGTFESYQRGQAIIIAQDMADRIQVNRIAASCYVVTTDTSAGTPFVGTGYTGTPACATAAGSAEMQTLAANDLSAWNNALKGAAETASGNNIGGLLGARGCISFDSSSSTYRVAVAWQGMQPTVAPTAGDASATCGKNLYGTENQRREVSITLQIATLT